jgi:hypothetical protein
MLVRAFSELDDDQNPPLAASHSIISVIHLQPMATGPLNLSIF